jgi:hypothetical protein
MPQEVIMAKAKKKPPSIGKDDINGLDLAAQFLSRLRTDAKFAESFDADPVAALRDQFPDLEDVPDASIRAALNAGSGAIYGAAMLSDQKGPVVISGFFDSVASAFAQGVAAAAGAAVVAAVTAEKIREPAPE